MKPRTRITSLALFGAGLLLLPAMPAGAEETLGRLFMTPERRESLDRQRVHNVLETQEVSEDPQLLVNGQVRRSSGKRTTWINGQAQNDNDARTGVVALPSPKGSHQVVIESGDEPRSNVKVGETLNRGTQETSSPLGDGKIVVNKPAPRGGR